MLRDSLVRKLTKLRAALARVEPRWILLAAWIIAIAYAFPGYMNWDSADQIWFARGHGKVPDWHPPLMGAYWVVLERVVRGPVVMLVLQVSLLLGGLYAASRQRFGRHGAAWLAAALLLYPPVLTPMAVVWKDAQMAAFLIAGTMLAIRCSWSARIAGLGLLVLAAGVRDNAAAALPPLLVLITSAWRVRGKLFVITAAAALFVLITVSATAANRWLTQERTFPWYQSTALFDIAGAICHEDPLTDDQVRAILHGAIITKDHDLQSELCRVYTPRIWFPISNDNFFKWGVATTTDRLARKAAWRTVVREHTSAWLSHRVAVARQLLGLTDDDLWEPVCQTYAAAPHQLTRLHHDASLSGFQKVMGKMFGKLSRTILYRPWLYAVLALALLAYALVRRDLWVVALTGSGLLYELGCALLTGAPDYRYSHWLVTCTCVATVFVFVDRFRFGSRTPGSCREAG